MKQLHITLAIIMMAGLLALPGAMAALKLDNIQFDPAIIASGDTVDIVVQYRATITGIEESKIDDDQYQFQIRLVADDDITARYVSVLDSAGDDLLGSVYSGETYNKRFRVKVAQDAPAGEYEFKLLGQWYKDGVAESTEQFVRFTMPVKKEGIILGISQLSTIPAEVRSGDEYVQVLARVENSGEKDAKAVEITLGLPENLESSYTDDNRRWVGIVGAGESKEVSFFVDVDEYANSGVQDITYYLNFMDTDNNKYQTSKQLPFRIKPRPYLEVVSSQGEGVAGGSGQLKVIVKNTGEESAEAVEVRIIKQSAQPFSLDVRSDYLGEIEPGEESTALFDIDVSSDAEQKDYSLKLLVRSKGDSDEGDDNIYTYTRKADFSVNGEAPNYLLYVGLVVLALIVIFVAIGKLKK